MTTSTIIPRVVRYYYHVVLNLVLHKRSSILLALLRLFICKYEKEFFRGAAAVSQEILHITILEIQICNCVSAVVRRRDRQQLTHSSSVGEEDLTFLLYF